ncbi:DUF4842 domain-containing protein [Phocaeicola sp.]
MDNEGVLYVGPKSQLINEGQLAVNGKGTSISGGDFYTGNNAYSSTISTTMNTGKWVNDGFYLSQEYFKIQAQSGLQNNCKLLTDELIYDAGNAGLNNAGHIQCSSATLAKGTLNLASASIFEVQETAEIWNFTINGSLATETKAPLLWINEGLAGKDKDENKLVSISANVHISCNNGFFDKIKNAQLVKATINEGGMTDCNPGYETEEPEEEPAIAEYTYAFEDITVKAGDYDFNDVVLRISNPINNEITVTLVAAGAMNDLWVCYDFGSGHKGELFDGKEVHAVFGEPAGTLINTGGTPTVAEQKCILKDLPEGFSLTENGDIYIVDKHGVEVHVDAHIGDVPYALRVPGSWEYPEERVSITTKYPEFGIWGQNANNSLDWYLPSKARK